uniref:Solute carrier family 25 member 44 n=1 Tax=Trichuris muris TaxID=70415 RepID=A0A5S6QD90_TRIMR
MSDRNFYRNRISMLSSSTQLQLTSAIGILRRRSRRPSIAVAFLPASYDSGYEREIVQALEGGQHPFPMVILFHEVFRRIGVSMDSLELSTMFGSRDFQVIEWQMMNMPKFLWLNTVSSLLIRTVVYPMTVVKTLIQVDSCNGRYRGTVSSFRRIVSQEGFSSLYRGFWINSFQILSGISYIMSYEKIKGLLSDQGIKSPHVRAFVGGGCASAFGQLILVPLDVVSQHIMVYRKDNRPVSGSFRKTLVASSPSASLDPLNLKAALERNPGAPLSVLVCREIYQKDGFLKGFYRGYFASLLCYAPSSALFWSLYQMYTGFLAGVCSDEFPILAINSVAAPAAAMSSSVLTNSLDVYRANLQVRRTGMVETLNALWSVERWRVFSKGLSTRMLSTSVSSFFFVTTYEFIKRLSVHAELKPHVHW